MSSAWAELERPGPEHIAVGGRELRAGSRVRLHPTRSGDIFDRALEGRLAVVERIEQDGEDRLHLAVSLEDDPGRALGPASQLGHRFFFSPDEVEPADDVSARSTTVGRILVAGIGNVFLGDDGFGVAVANALAEADTPPGVEVEEFGIRGMDLAYALTRGHDAAILLDAAARGEAPGTLSVIEPGEDDGELALETHGMDPLKVLGLARALGPLPRRVLIVACEPATVLTGEEGEVVMELSESVQAAVTRAAALVRSLVDELTEGDLR
jgi:hydrogenase maturation protease